MECSSICQSLWLPDHNLENAYPPKYDLHLINVVLILLTSFSSLPPVVVMESKQEEGLLHSTVMNSSSSLVSKEPYPSLSPEVRAFLATAFGRGLLESVLYWSVSNS